MEQEFSDIKKVELHCHLDGSIPEQTIPRLAANLGRRIPEPEELRKMVRARERCGSLREYLDCFALPLELLTTEENIQEAVESLLAEAAKEQVIYMEIRFAPLSLTSGGLDCRHIIQAAVRGLEKGKKEQGISGGLILCGMRNTEAETNCRMLREGKKYLGAGVCGADIAGDEAAFPIQGQRAFFQEATRLGIPFTIHAGECGSAESVRHALELGASRIGHGIAASSDPRLMEELRRGGVCLELCPISNLQTGASSEEDYPFEVFREAGVKVTVNTDNRTVSNTSLTKEFEWLRAHFGITAWDARSLTRDAVMAAFAPEETKIELLRLIG